MGVMMAIFPNRRTDDVQSPRRGKLLNAGNAPYRHCPETPHRMSRNTA